MNLIGACDLCLHVTNCLTMGVRLQRLYVILRIRADIVVFVT